MAERTKKNTTKSPAAERLREEGPADSGWLRNRRVRFVAVLIVGAVAIGVAYWIVKSDRDAPERRFQAALSALHAGDLTAVRLEMSALNGLDAYEPHLAYLEAELLVEEGRYAEALRRFEASADNDELRALTLTGKGRALYGMGDFSAAEALWNQSLELQPDAPQPQALLDMSRGDQRPQRRFERGLAALDAGERGVVQTELAALQTFPAWMMHARFLQGAMLLKDRRPQDALKLFDEAAAHPQLRARALAKSGETLFAMGRFQEGEKKLLSALEVDLYQVDAHRWLGRWYFNQGANDLAAGHLLKVASLDPTDYLALRQMGLLSKDFEKYSLAVDYYTEALKRNPPTHIAVEICVELAEAQIRMRRFEEALQSLQTYDAAVEKLPANMRMQLDAKTNLPTTRLVLDADCQYSLGRPDEAQQKLYQALQRSADDLQALLLAAKIAQAQRDAPAAVAALTRAVTAHPKDYQAHFQLAQACRLAGDEPGAKQAQATADELKRLREEFSKLHKTAASEPENVDVRFRLGLMALEMGLEAETAKMWLAAALAIDPRHEGAQQQLKLLQSQ